MKSLRNEIGVIVEVVNTNNLNVRITIMVSLFFQIPQTRALLKVIKLQSDLYYPRLCYPRFLRPKLSTPKYRG